MIKKTIRRGDDFKAIITLKDREELPLDATTAQFRFIYRDVYDNRYEVSYDGINRINNYVDGDQLVGVFENYKLSCGVLKREAWYWVADPAFIDGRWNYGDTQSSDIELTEQGGVKEVEEIVEVPDGICVNETLVVSKGDKGDPFVYEDFTPEQLSALKGEPFRHEDFTPDQLEALRGDTGGKGDTPYIADDVWWISDTNTGVKAKGVNGVNFIPTVDAESNISWTNDGGLSNPQPRNIKGKTGATGPDGKIGKTGETGKSAYQLAVEAGYAGTEAQFKTEQASIANNSARLTNVEKSKANLVEGFVPSQEINPLQGKQTGAEIDGVNYLSDNASESFSKIIGNSNFSIEFYYDSNKLTMPSGAIYGLCSISDIVSIYRQSTGDISYQLINRRMDGTRYSLNLANIAPYNGRLHIVLAANRTTNEFTGYINNVKFDQKIFTEKISHNINTVITIGETKIGAAKTNITQFRVFNRELMKDDVASLWNGGHPEEYRLIDKTSLIAEYIPEYLSLMGWKDSSGNGIDLVATGNVALSYGKKYSGSPMTPLFMARGAVWNASTGFYELNGLTDITEAQMIEIYNQSAGLLGGDWSSAFYQSPARTAFLKKALDAPVTAVECFRDAAIETLSFTFKVGITDVFPKIENANLMFHNCRVLKKITGNINCLMLTNTTNMFTGCAALETVQLYNLKISVGFAFSHLLTRDSIVYLITNAANTSPITVTLHAEAKARLTPEDIALASSKNITIA